MIYDQIIEINKKNKRSKMKKFIMNQLNKT